MEDDRDLLEIFDAALPRLETYGPDTVPKAGSKEKGEHGQLMDVRRQEFGLSAAATGTMAFLTWFLTNPWMPPWITMPILCLTVLAGGVTAVTFSRLAFAPRLEQALPPGTDAASAQLEDGTLHKIRWWNYEAMIWNQRVLALRTEVSGWQVLRSVPAARDIEWTEAGSRIQAEGLIAAMQGLAADRSALVARKGEIDYELRRLDARLHQLKASEEAPTLALPQPEDPSEE